MKKMIEIEKQMNEIDIESSNDSDRLTIMSDKLNGIEFNPYHNGKIYKLTSNETDDVYFGSTTKTLSQRKSGHNKAYKRHLKGKHGYITSFKLIKFLDCRIELVAKIICNNKKELEEHEALYIKNNQCVNKIVPGRTDKEYRQDNKEKISEYKKKYRRDNLDKINKQYQYNKEKISERHKRYRLENLDKIKANKSKKCICECGSEYIHNHKSRHIRSNKHQEYLSSSSQSE